MTTNQHEHRCAVCNTRWLDGDPDGSCPNVECCGDRIEDRGIDDDKLYRIDPATERVVSPEPTSPTVQQQIIDLKHKVAELEGRVAQIRIDLRFTP